MANQARAHTIQGIADEMIRDRSLLISICRARCRAILLMSIESVSFPNYILIGPLFSANSVRTIVKRNTRNHFSAAFTADALFSATIAKFCIHNQ